MSTNLASAEDIANIISQEVDLMTALVQILRNEEQVLIDNAAEKLETIVVEKNSLLTQIIALEKNRNQQLSQAGFGTDAEGMNLLLQSFPNESSVKINWMTLLELSTAAKEKNRTNGILINRQMTRNQAALNVLQQNDQTAAVYGADGQSRVNSSSGRGIVAG